LTLIVLLAGVAVVAGCDHGSASPPSDGESDEVRLGYFGNVTHAQAVLGTATGDFAAAVAPVKFSTKVFNAGPSLIEALLTGNIDIGYVGPGPALSAWEKSHGQGIRVIAGAAANGVLIVARKGANISALSDLAGKKIATPQQGNTQDIAARHYLTAVLKQADTNNVIPVANAEQAGLMQRGEIDAAWAPEPWGSRLIAEAGAVKVAEEKELWPNKKFVLTVVVATPDFIRKHPETVRKVLSVHTKWTSLLQQEPQKYETQLVDALFALSGKRLPPGVVDRALETVGFTNNPLPETFTTMGQWAFELGFAKGPPKIDGLIDLSLLKQPQ
jgi:NitT/TauT family transport system substrate-binding protein